MKRPVEKEGSATPEKNERRKAMKKTNKYRYFIVTVLVVLGIIILDGGCSGKVVPEKSTNQNKTLPATESAEKIQNFNYLFTEALKQKIFGNYKNAMKYFLECEKIKPDDAVEYQISGIFAISGQGPLAVKYGEMALQKDPGNIWYYYQLASEFQMLGETDSLISLYERIVNRFPELVKEKMTLGDLYLQNKQPEKALKVYMEIEKKYGKSIELEKKMIRAYANNKKYEKALGEIRSAEKLVGEDKELWLMKAGIMQSMQKSDEAEEIFDTLIRRYPSEPQVVMAAYGRYMQKKNYEKALQLLEKIINNDQIAQNRKLDYMFELISNEDPLLNAHEHEIRKLVKEIYEKGKDDLRTQLFLVDYYSRKEENEKAMDVLRKMIVKFPGFKIGWQQILYISEKMQKPDTVLYYAEQGMKIFKDDPLFYVYMCSAYIGKNKNEKVTQYAENGLKLALLKGVDYVEKETGVDYKTIIIQLYGYLGEAYKNLKQFKKSDQAFEEGLKVDPENSYLLNNYSYYLSLRKEKLKKALRMSGITLKKEPNNDTYLDTYGWILYNMGKVREAKKYIRKALENGGASSPDILEHYGDILYKNGDKHEAVKYWKLAIEKKGNKKKLEKKIESARSE